MSQKSKNETSLTSIELHPCRAIGHKETPEEFDNKVMDLLKQHAKNEDRESRIRMPDLH